MIKINGLSVSRIPINGKETLRVMRNGEQLWSGTGLPAGYTLLEYIESTGAQWIDTGFKPNNNTRVVVDCILNTGNAYPTIIGTVNSTSIDKYTLLALNTTTTRHYYGSKETDFSYSLIGKRMLVEMNKEVLNIDNVKIMTGVVSTFSCTNNMYLLSYMGNASFNSYGKIYLCQIYDNNNLVRDYIPCKNPSGACGLYDKVNKIFYGSASSTGFIGE